MAAHRFLVPRTDLDVLQDKSDPVTHCTSPCRSPARHGSIKGHLHPVPAPTPLTKCHRPYFQRGQNNFHIKVGTQRKLVIYRVNINNPWTICNLIKRFYGVYPVCGTSGCYFCRVPIGGCINCRKREQNKETKKPAQRNPFFNLLIFQA